MCEDGISYSKIGTIKSPQSAAQRKNNLLPSCAYNSWGIWKTYTSTWGLKKTDFDQDRTSSTLECSEVEEYDCALLNIDYRLAHMIELELTFQRTNLLQAVSTGWSVLL